MVSSLFNLEMRCEFMSETTLVVQLPKELEKQLHCSL